MSTQERRRKPGDASMVPPEQRNMEEMEATDDEQADVPSDGGANVRRRAQRPADSEDDLWDDDADAGLGGAGPVKRRIGSQPLPKRRKRDGWRNPENWMMGLQSCLCCGAMVMTLVACLMPYLVDKLNGDVKELVRQGDVTSLQMRMDSDPKFKVNAIGDQELTALHWATIKEKPDVATLLLERRANIHAESNRGMMPLHYAARDGHKTMTELLVDHNATVNAPDAQGWSPLFWSVVYGHEKMTELLLELRADPLQESGDRYHGTAKSLAESNRLRKIEKILGDAEAEEKRRKAEEAARLKAEKEEKQGGSGA